MRRALEALDDQLSQRAPKLQQLLRPGLNEETIEEILGPFPHSVPTQLRELYRWHDGTEWPAFLFPGAQWLPLGKAVKNRADALEGDRRSGRALWDSRWLPIFTDGSDGFSVVACGDGGGKIVSFFFVDLPDTWSEFNDLRSLVESLIRRWSTGAYLETDDGDIEEDRRAVAALRRADDPEPPDVDQLVNALDKGSLEAWSQALLRLRLGLYPEAVVGLLRLLQTGSDRGRRSAAELLGLIGDRVALRALEAALADRDELVRVLARNALKELASKSGS